MARRGVWDPTGPSLYAKARFLDPKLGRFLTQDSFLGDIDEPPSLHRYVYANDNPTTYIDPTGHEGIAAAGQRNLDQLERSDPVVYTNEQGGNIAIRDPNAPVNRQKSAVLDDDATNRLNDQTLAEYSEPQNAPKPGIVEEPSSDEGESLLDKALGAAGDAAAYLPRKGRDLAEQGGNLVLREAFGANKPRGSLSQNEIALGRDADQMMANRLKRSQESLAEHGGYGAGIAAEKGIEYVEGKVVQKTLDTAGEAANAVKKTVKGPKTRVVYRIRDAEDRTLYVGRASGKGTPDEVLRKRASSHAHRGAGEFKVEDVQGSRAANRGAEDVIYNRERLKAEQEGRKLLNKDNPISPRNPLRRHYVNEYNNEAVQN